MNTVTLLTQIQHVAAATTVLCFVLFLFRRRRDTRLSAIHPILFGSQLTAAVFCGCLALRAGLDAEIDLLRFWLGACGAVFALLTVLLSYRTLWFELVEASARPPWPMSEAPTTSAPAASTGLDTGKPPSPAADSIYPDHGLSS